jgi:hypothetical protein
MNQRTRALEDALRLYHARTDGILSTQSSDMPGYPFGSVMPFCLDRGGMPVIQGATIAQHSRNMQQDPRVSLIVFEREAPDLQNAGRLTVLADATPLGEDDEDARERYFRYYPEARGYRNTHDFNFWRLQPRRFRYIGGFGLIHWFSPADLLVANPLAADEDGIVRHMNEDHLPAMRRYCDRRAIAVPDEVPPRLAGLDALGFHLRVGARLVRFGFQAPVNSPADARREFVALAQA